MMQVPRRNRGLFLSDAATSRRWNETNPGNHLIRVERDSVAKSLLMTHGIWPVSNLRVLEVGSGDGRVLADFATWGAPPENLMGVDINRERVERARKLFHLIGFSHADAQELGFTSGAFDIVIAYTMFSSILEPTTRTKVSNEIERVLKPGGAILWYDMRYPSPRNLGVRPMRRREIERLFPNFECYFQTTTLIPPLARKLGPFTKLLYPIFGSLPFLRSHFVVLLRRRTSKT